MDGKAAPDAAALGGQPPRHRDGAFLGWVKKFTKRKRPA
jgi:hypothetical protein